MDTPRGTERARTTLAYLRRQITTGEWGVGDRIPIEPELTEMLGVGRSTIREAVRSLASIGMLETLPGRGTFVRSSTPTSAVLSEFLAAYTLEELLSYRRALEVEAAQQAALHRTPEDIAALEAAVAQPLMRSHCPAHGNDGAGAEVAGTTGAGGDSDGDDEGDGDGAGEGAAGASGTGSHGVTGSSADLAARFHHLLFDAAKNRLLASLYAGISEKLAQPAHVGRLVHAADAATMQEEHELIMDAVRRGDFIDAVHAMADHMDNDLVIVTPDDQIIPALQRSPAAQRRIGARVPREEESGGT
nr:FadR family transcriptional regulator [Actinomycetales bacterium]